MKKGKWLIVSFIVMLCLLITSNAFASTKEELGPNEILVFEADEINDVNTLFDRAQKGVSDVKAKIPVVKLKDNNGKFRFKS